MKERILRWIYGPTPEQYFAEHPEERLFTNGAGYTFVNIKLVDISKFSSSSPRQATQIKLDS